MGCTLKVDQHLGSTLEWLMSQSIRPDSFVVYKNRPARITNITEKKIDIQTDKGEQFSVRPKDVLLLHPGPLRNFQELRAPAGEVVAAWELLAGGATTLPELADLAYQAYTPATAWAIWQLLEDGLYFSGEPETISAHSSEKVATIQAAREAKAAEERAWNGFLSRTLAGQYERSDERYISDVVALALEQRTQSRVLRTLGREETPQNAHALLMAIGYWSPLTNPYPQRLGVTTSIPDLALPNLVDEPRRDLTHLLALAIDDEGAMDPDDALSWADGRLWVHVADVAALTPPNSPMDQEARARGANLYLPEGVVPMLPPQATDQLGLGLLEISPALSFGLTLNALGELSDIEITPSWVRVTRLTYEDVEDRLEETPFSELYALGQRYAVRRRANGAIELSLPEVKIRVIDGQVVIKPLPPLRSRDLVREAMLMTGEAVARYAQANTLAVPFSVQEAPEEVLDLTSGDLSAMFAQRRLFKPSQHKSTPSAHSGLGLDAYVQATSPLRRYSDLLTHQQLRAHLRQTTTLDAQTILTRMAEATNGVIATRRAERMSNTHWKLVALLQQPDWQGEGVVVEKAGARNVVLIPTLELETEIYGRPDLALDEVVKLALSEVNLPMLETRFRVLKG
jgi:exoribonuclease-2